ncbi:glycosyltransferase family 9 protein [Desulfocurvus sp. DL9XJH121]
MPEALPNRWLVVRLSALGDVVLTTGVLEHLARTRGWSFHFLTKKAFAPALTGHPAVEKLVLPDSGNLDGRAWLQACRQLAERYQGWGLLDLHGTMRSLVLGAVWKGPVRRYPKFTLARRLYGVTGWPGARRTLEALNVPQRYALAVERTAPPASALVPRITLSEDEKLVGRRLAAATGTDGPLAALHPYATHAGKRWPEEHWLDLAGRLHRAGWRMAVIGRDPAPLCGQTPLQGVTDYTNRTDIRQTCALLAQCDVLVSGDSGPMHLATAVGTRVAALFGPTTRAWGFYPSGPDDTVLERDLSCRPCSLHGGRGCRHGQRCMADIDPADVAEAVLRQNG